MWMHMYHGTHVVVKGQFMGVGSLLTVCGFQVSNSGCKAWWPTITH